MHKKANSKKMEMKKIRIQKTRNQQFQKILKDILFSFKPDFGWPKSSFHLFLPNGEANSVQTFLELL